ncbi:MAG: DUF4037 domain-containing protein [Scytonema sp. RU_4_4]|nr:DUF4037 domain-containing protein [Scytonema sp. RU_4_4]NJR76303.1 DUF4037 domain-containing protein [Scytonema sp. CRU_2_7]
MFTNNSLAQTIASEFSKLPQVIAVALAGSQAVNASDELSDLDFYIYIQEEISIDIRSEISKKFANHSEINNQFWEPGDEWIDTNSGHGIDIMYRSPQWIEAQLDSLLVKHQASVGYSTCFWWNILHSTALYDRNNWFQQLQQKANQPYPEALRQAIIAKNYPILRNNVSSYLHQIELAVNRNDFISINHRIAALIASYFDIIFAVNYVPSPGEKRLIQFAHQLCQKLPVNLEQNINTLICCIPYPFGSQGVVSKANTLIDSLDELLIVENLIAP